jgi:hypothetical protein
VPVTLSEGGPGPGAVADMGCHGAAVGQATVTVIDKLKSWPPRCLSPTETPLTTMGLLLIKRSNFYQGRGGPPMGRSEWRGCYIERREGARPAAVAISPRGDKAEYRTFAGGRGLMHQGNMPFEIACKSAPSALCRLNPSIYHLKRTKLTSKDGMIIM